jgi:hypothetical protein
MRKQLIKTMRKQLAHENNLRIRRQIGGNTQNTKKVLHDAEQKVNQQIW